MTTPTPHGQVPEALNQLFERLEDCIYEWSNYVRADDAPTTLPKYTAGAINDLRVAVTELYLRTQQPAPATQQAHQQEAQPNYVVSLVVVKEIPTGVNTQNKLYTVNAASADEAVGKAVLQMPSDFPEHRLHTACFVAAPAQPAPAPLSERDAFERDWEKRHAPVPINGRTHDDGRYGDSSIQDAWESWQARAAIAAQKGTP